MLMEKVLQRFFVASLHNEEVSASLKGSTSNKDAYVVGLYIKPIRNPSGTKGQKE